MTNVHNAHFIILKLLRKIFSIIQTKFNKILYPLKIIQKLKKKDQKKHFIEEYIDTENIYLLCLPHISSLFHQMLKSSAASDRNILREIDISQASHSMHQSSENSPDQSLQFVDELFKNQFEGNFEFLMGLGSKFIAKIKEARESLVSDPVKYKDMISLIDYSISNFQRK